MMQRREILRRVAWMLGGAVSAPAALAILQGCSAKEAAPGAAAFTPKFLDGPSQMDIVTEIAEIIIPKTDTSGAIDAGVPAFIDLDAGRRVSEGCAGALQRGHRRIRGRGGRRRQGRSSSGSPRSARRS